MASSKARTSTDFLSTPPAELAEPFDMSMPGVSEHLRVLERAGLIARGREAQWRPCRLEPAPIKEVAAWADHYRAIWERRFDRLDTYLQRLASKDRRKKRRGKMAVSSVANSHTFKVTTPSGREIRLTRLFDAPRELVFEAMTKPEQVKQWWGCLGEGYSVPVCEIDLRPGGKWRFANRHPHGEAVFYGEYREIVPPERVIFTEFYEPYPDGGSLVTTMFAEENGKTRVTVTALYPSPDVRDMVLKSGMEKGAAISYDRLEEVAQGLAKTR